jgi:hypothetical protein
LFPLSFLSSGRLDYLRPTAYDDPFALIITQEASSRLRRNGFVFPSALENKFSPLPKKTKPAAFAAGFLSVGTTGFEPATPCTPCKCATGLRYVPKGEFQGCEGNEKRQAGGKIPRLFLKSPLSQRFGLKIALKKAT